MPFNVKEMVGTLSRQGVSRASDYRVNIQLPGEAARTFNAGAQDLSLRAEALELPGRSIQAVTYRDYGVPREIGYSILYQPISVTFICSRDLRERALFTNWQDSVIGDHRKVNFADGKSFNAGYYDEYVADMEIVKYDERGEKTFTVKIIEAYPRTVNAMPLSYASDELMRVTVQFQYRYFQEFINSADIPAFAATPTQARNSFDLNDLINIASNPKRFATEKFRGVVRTGIDNLPLDPAIKNVINRKAKNLIKF